ncbi:MAG: glycoside hydrolase family 9 protein, partial [Acidobacteria bacterium]|nr:glycoside hydrolase family 9 protein [Acidobacteriota bacterium]
MNRRRFLGLGLAAPAARLAAQQDLPLPEHIEAMTPAATPAIALNHLGFLPKSKKVVIVRYTGEQGPAEFTIRDIGGPRPPFRQTRPLQPYASGVIQCLVGDFSDIERQAMYQVSVAGEVSVPFFIRPDVWRRTLPKAAGYYRQQRCGVEVAGVHPICHLDDARRRDNGKHIDVTGGWHDAGDLRKWISTALMNSIGLLRLARNLGARQDVAGLSLASILEEVRWGNVYLLKMQDTDGLVWADAAGGVNGDNSDNHWTDNRIGTADDRFLNPDKSGGNQALFVTAQAMAAQAFQATDAAYARRCLDAARRCWDASRRQGDAGELSWWVLAALELWRATRSESFAAEAARLGGKLLALQTTDFVGSQKEIRGFWRGSDRSPDPYTEAVSSALPPLAVLELALALPRHRDAAR